MAITGGIHYWWSHCTINGNKRRYKEADHTKKYEIIKEVANLGGEKAIQFLKEILNDGEYGYAAYKSLIQLGLQEDRANRLLYNAQKLEIFKYSSVTKNVSKLIGKEKLIQLIFQDESALIDRLILFDMNNLDITEHQQLEYYL